MGDAILCRAVVEEGTHHDLLEANGQYAKLWRIQREQQV